VHLLSGYIASGKSTLADLLKDEYGAVVFSADEWVLGLLGQDFPVERFNECGDNVKNMIWSVASTLVRDHGLDVVLDFSFWQRAERDAFKARVRALGANFRLYHTSCPDEIILERLERRNRELPPGNFFIAPETFRMWREAFEPPTPAEDADVLILDTTQPEAVIRAQIRTMQSSPARDCG